MSSTQYSAATDVGLRRTNNEDTILSNPRAGLWLVADGMGGHAAGEVASAIVAETIEKEINRGSNLQVAVQRAHDAVIRAAEAGIGGVGMGSTVVALHSQGLYYDVAWVGDSRAYLWQPESQEKGKAQLRRGELQQLTTDHSYVQMLFETGAISAAEMDNHPDRNIITQCLGSTDINTLKVDICRQKWQPGDVVLLCSDGLSDSVTSDQIGDILQRHSSNHVEAATRDLIKLALDNGGSDNISVSLVVCPTTRQRTFQAARLAWQRIKDRLGV